MRLSLVFTFFLLILIPDSAYAWGPATHLELGWDILNHLKPLPLFLQELLSKFPYDYLYGNISADIVIGKNLTQQVKHCHNWRIGLKVMKSAKTDPQKAFATATSAILQRIPLPIIITSLRSSSSHFPAKSSGMHTGR